MPSESSPDLCHGDFRVRRGPLQFQQHLKISQKNIGSIPLFMVFRRFDGRDEVGGGRRRFGCSLGFERLAQNLQ